MTRFHLALAAAAALALPLAASAEAAKPAAAKSAAAKPAAPIPDNLKDPRAQASYTLGYNLGANLHKDQVVVDPDVFALGIRDGNGAAPPQLSLDVMRDVLAKLQANIKEKRQALFAKSAQENKAEGDAFLKTNAARKGVITLPSGLQYEVLKTGSGPIPKPDDVVDCAYRGTLISGQEFDSSYARGKPAEFPVKGVIKGWTEALQRMPVGSHWKLYVPPELAYGDEGREGVIGPNLTLVFDLELLDIEGKD
jgi:FKBP-type peptidyl-prolyl cis-trans isomerase FklB